ncbi:MAG: phospholipid carrier-dependent glycosyltransferase, partial [Rhizonema sp. PD38]|nr:phospholipid carrier-dependent glycosyltransferase [Rhizonema sp. PD38]
MSKKWFWIGISAIFLLSISLRFWGLARFNSLVFDELYYAKFGNDYLTHTPFFDGHPPLGKLIIALGIWISTHIPFSPNEVNGLTGRTLSPLNYRWMNAFSGSFIPLIVAGIAYQLSYRRSFALLAGLFTACDGIFLVESRYALINQYIVIFGLLGQWFLLLALANQRQQRKFWLVLSGIAFGASVAT